MPQITKKRIQGYQYGTTTDYDIRIYSWKLEQIRCATEVQSYFYHCSKGPPASAYHHCMSRIFVVGTVFPPLYPKAFEEPLLSIECISDRVLLLANDSIILLISPSTLWRRFRSLKNCHTSLYQLLAGLKKQQFGAEDDRIVTVSPGTSRSNNRSNLDNTDSMER